MHLRNMPRHSNFSFRKYSELYTYNSALEAKIVHQPFSKLRLS